MWVFMIIIASLILLIAAFATFSVIKDVDTKIKEYEKSGDSLQSEVIRSHKYEQESLRTNIKSLSWIYVAIVLILIVVSLIFIFYK